MFLYQYYCTLEATGFNSYTASNWSFLSSVKWWLIKINVRSDACNRLFSTISAFFWSSAEVLSSTSKIERLWISARAMATRCFAHQRDYYHFLLLLLPKHSLYKLNINTSFQNFGTSELPTEKKLARSIKRLTHTPCLEWSCLSPHVQSKYL